MTPPVFAYSHSGTDGAGTTGGASANGGAFYIGTVYPPQYQQALFILDYNRRWIRYLTFDAQGKATVNNFGRETARGMVQVLTGPDTNLYAVVLAGSGSQVRRIRYVGAGNTPPTAVASATPTIGTAPLAVTFSSLGSFDPDAQPLSYSWTFGDGGTSTAQHPSHTYAAAGVYTATLTLTELTSPFASRTAEVVVTVGNEPPLASITAPTDGTTYRIGDVITYSGSGTSGGQPVDPSQLSWEVRLHHNQHIHFNLLPGGASGTFQIIEHGDNTSYELCLTETVPPNLTDTRCMNLLPQTTPITLTTDPPGLFVNYEDEGLTQASPMIVNPVVGSDQTVSVQAIQGGRTFVSWSDGETSTSHPFGVGDAPATYTAQYINRPPVAVAQASPLSGTAPLTVTFTGSGSSDPEFGTLNHRWDFGDGSSATTADPVHTYAATGTYEAVLTVTDQLDGASSQPMTVTVVNTCGNGQIDAGEACDGGACCTAGCQFATAGSECRESTGVCDLAETCSGSAAACPANAVLPNGTSCGDGNACNGAETCHDGACTSGTALVCNDGNVCTDDACNPATGCIFTDNTAPCSDGVACTTDVCAGGACTSASVCAAGETCNAATGLCDLPPGPYTIWPQPTVPSGVMAGPDSAVELGVKFRSDVAGYVTGIRFYKYGLNTGTHVGNLWSNTGTRLATATFTDESPSGWQEVTFSSPVPITAGAVYVASYFAPNGYYAIAANFFAGLGVDTPPLHALANGVAGANGVFAYGTPSTFPTSSYATSNYWVDVVFTTQAPAPGPLTITTATLPDAMQGVPYTATLAAAGGTPPYAWTIATGALPDGLTLDAGTGVIAGTPTTAGTYSVGVVVSASQQAATRTFTITVEAPVQSLWPSTTSPAGFSGADDPVELGVKFRSDVAGYITGIRFYKHVNNTGTHIGSLWSSSGTRLATATFSGESASGWQQLTFPQPVAIAANTVYIASYHAPAGYYAIALNFFDGQGVDRPPLHALANGVAGPNGVFAYGPASTFPSGSYGASNYYVDAVFSAVAPTLEAITVTPASPSVTTGATQQFTATGTYADGSTQTLTTQVTWASSHASVATVNGVGRASAVSAGTTTITATLGALVGSATLEVNPPGPLAITTTALPDGTLQRVYAAAVSATGATPPYSWAITGQLPPGLVLNASSGAISGTATAVGIYDFTVTAHAGTQTAARALSITVGELASHNAIVAENELPGNPASEWDISGAGDPSRCSWTTARRTTGCRRRTT